MKNTSLYGFIFVLLLATAGRILNIDAESLWVDEGFSYWAIRHPAMLDVLVNDVHPPLYFVALRGWASLTGISELALRYFSVLPSLLSVAMIAPLARELDVLRGGRRSALVALLAALALALADMENYIAQEARMYTWHVLWVIVSMWAFTRWINTRRRALIAVWIIANLLLVYTHYIGTAAVAVQGLYVLLFLRGRRRLEAVGALALVGGLFVPWLLVVVAGQTGNIGTGFNVPSTLTSLWDWRDEWFTGQWALLGGLALLGVVAPLMRPGETAAPRKFSASFLLLAWLVVPVAGAYVLNLYTPILMDYRLTQITPAVALMIAFGLVAIPAPTRIFLVAVIVVYGVAIDETPRPRPPWREVGANAARYATPGDLALAHVTPSGDWQVMYYYERFMPPDVKRRSLRQWQLEDVYGTPYTEGLPALLEENDHVWLMHWSNDTSAFDYLRATGHQQTAVMREDWLGNALNVYRYDVVPPPDDAQAAYVTGMVLRDAAIHAAHVDLWWSAAAPLSADYTVSVFVLDANGVLVAQDDSIPFAGQRPTSTWGTDEVIYDPHPLDFDALPPGEYTVGVKVYQFTGDGINDQPTTDGDEFAVIGQVVR